LRRKHDAAAARIGVERLEDVGQTPNQCYIEKIVWRPANFDYGDMPFAAHGYICCTAGFTHVRIPRLVAK
jgi:hypothetical protein